MAVEFTYRDGSPIREGDVVQRGKGKTRWRVTRLIDWQGEPMVALASTTGYTSASVMRDGIAGLTRIENTETPMTITANRAQLADAVALAAQAIPSRPSQAQQAVLTLLPEEGVVRVIGANYDTQLEATVPATWTTSTPVVVPGRFMAEWLKGERGDVVEISIEGGTTRLKGRRTLTLDTPAVDAHEPAEYVAPGSDRRATASLIDRDRFTDALKRVGGAVSHDDALPAFTGVHITATEGGVALATTDRYKMAHVGIEVGEDPLGLSGPEFSALPRHRELTSLLGHMPGPTVDLVREDGVLWVFSGNVRARIATIEADFPKIQHIFDMGQPMATTVDVAGLRTELQAATRLIQLSVTSKTAKVRLSSESGAVDVQVVDDHVSSTGVPVDCDGDVLDVDMNPTHLLGALDAVGPVERVTLHHFGPTGTKPVRLDSPESTGVGVVMPMRRANS